ncbi:MAG: hypothetical protein AAGU11_02915 [Syntrophobacteraceae bacterium]
MLQILLITARPEALSSFIEGISSKGQEVCLEQVTSGAEALNVVRNRCPHLVIVDSENPDSDALSLVRDMIMTNAMVNTAVISGLPESDFHDKSEGLGILCQLPLKPDHNDSEALLLKLREILGV